MTCIRRSVILLGILVLGGCAANSTKFPDTTQVLSSSRLLDTGPALSSSDYQDAADRLGARVASRLMSMDDAVTLGILNSPALRSILARENLLTVDFVDDVGAGRAADGASSSEWIIIQRALRRPANGGERLAFGLAYAEAVSALVPIASEARAVWINAVAALQTEATMRQITDSLKAEADLANEQHMAGTLSRGGLARHHIALGAALREHGAASRDVVVTREKLVRTLGLWGPAAAVKLPERLPDLPAVRPTFVDLEPYAVTHRMDLVLARQQGGARERAIEVRSEVRENEATLLLAYDAASHQQKVVVPESLAALESAQLEYNGMLVGIFDLLEGLRTQMEAGRGYVETLRDFWLAESAFRAAIGGEMPPPAKS